MKHQSEFLFLLNFSKEFASKTAKRFSSEDIRFELESMGLALRDNSNYGTAMRQLKNLGIIKQIDHKKAEIKTSKSREIPVYISNEYSRIQSQNRKVLMPELPL